MRRHPTRLGRIVLLAATAMFLVACGSGDSALIPTEATQVTLGRSVYEANCAACHGVNGEGQENWQRPDENGVLPAPPHDGSGHTWHHPDPHLLRIIAEGGQSPGSQMPGYADSLTQAEMEAVLAYIKSFWTPEIRDAQADITRRSP